MAQNEGTSPVGDGHEPVAESYAGLQSLPALFEATSRGAHVPAGSDLGAARACFQACEVVLVVLVELMARATSDAENADLDRLTRRITWMTTFAKAWVDLAWRIRDLDPDRTEPPHVLRTLDSPGWWALKEAETAFERSVEKVRPMLDEATRSALLRYLMCERTALEYAVFRGAEHSYGELVDQPAIRAAVLEQDLPRDTAFLQFRAAHQIPELLVRALNDGLSVACREIEEGHVTAALGPLYSADRLADALVRSADILVDRLTESEYHDIRRNLGLTSGSHSLGIHYGLMREGIPRLHDTRTLLEGRPAPEAELALRYARAIELHTDRWRLKHLNLPRNNLGGPGTGTRSLTGSTDAVQVVTRMREAGTGEAFADRPAEFRATHWTSHELPLRDLESRILLEVARDTQEHFPDVQSRTGIFARRPGFRPPRPD